MKIFSHPFLKNICQAWEMTTLPSKASWFLWFVSGFMILAGLSQSIFAFLYIYSLKDFSSSSSIEIQIYAFVELLRILFSGMIFFAFFYRAENRGFVPGPAIRDSAKETFAMLIALLFVSSGRPFIIVATQRLLGWSTDIEEATYIWEGVLFFGIGSIYLVRWMQSLKRSKLSFDQALVSQRTLSQVQINALYKTQTRLSPSQRRELAILLYRSRSLNQTIIKNVVKLLWSGLVIALIIQIAQEFFGRL